MGVVGDVWNALKDLFLGARKQREARNVTRTNLTQMRKCVEVALEYERWPTDADTTRWHEDWKANRSALAMNEQTLGALDEPYSFASKLEHSIVTAGAHEFDNTSPNPGEDRDFFERYRDAIDRAAHVLE
jgi:hypothetical protein